VSPGPGVARLEQALERVARAARWIGALVLVAIAASGVTAVGPDEVALRLRFGRLTGASPAEQVHGPGLLLSLPYLVDRVVRVPVRRIHEVPVTALTAPSFTASDRLDVSREGYALAGDTGIVQLRGVLKYQITDPVAWALRIEEPERRLQAAVVAALTRTVAEMPADRILVGGGAELAAAGLGRAQERLDAGGAWVRLVALEFTVVAPPPQVARAFEEVQSAFVERKTRVEEARRYREQTLPAARAEAENQVRSAEADEAGMVEKARGAASAFLALADQYRRDGPVLRQRLYRETVETVMAAVGSRVVIDPAAGRRRVLIPGEVDQGEWRGPK
jgi:membrane protease subunit HflK